MQEGKPESKPKVDRRRTIRFSESIAIKLERDLLKSVDSEVRETDRTRSYVIRQAIKDRYRRKAPTP